VCPGFAMRSVSNLTVKTIHPAQGERAKNNCFAEHKVGLQNQSLSGVELVLLYTEYLWESRDFHSFLFSDVVGKECVGGTNGAQPGYLSVMSNDSCSAVAGSCS